MIFGNVLSFKTILHLHSTPFHSFDFLYTDELIFIFNETLWESPTSQ